MAAEWQTNHGNNGTEAGTIGIIGLGALGTLYAYHLTKALGPERVFVLADAERIRRYRTEGVFFNGERCSFSYLDVAEAKPVTLLLVCCKYLALPQVIGEMRPAVGPETVIISVLNGIASEPDLRAAFSPDQVVSCIARKMAAVKDGNQVTVPTPGELVIGAETPEQEKALRIACELFSEADFPYVVSDDIRKELWGKLLCNDGVNQACVIYEGKYRIVHEKGEIRDTMLKAMREVMRCAQAEGVDLSEDDVAYWLNVIDHLNPDGEPSMRQDAKAHRRTEVELFSGTVSRLGKKHGIPTPVNDAWYQKIRDMEESWES